MTGPEHYRKAEEILGKLTVDETRYVIHEQLLAAQVHATLGLAAATALGVMPWPENVDATKEWEPIVCPISSGPAAEDES